MLRKGQAREPANTAKPTIDRWVLGTVTKGDESAGRIRRRQAGAVVCESYSYSKGIHLDHDLAALFAKSGDRICGILDVFSI